MIGNHFIEYNPIIQTGGILLQSNASINNKINVFFKLINKKTRKLPTTITFDLTTY